MKQTINILEEFSVGVPGLDAEHEAICAGFDAVEHAIRATQGKQHHVESRIVRLIKLTRKHFQHEMEIMERFNYPDIELHAKDHAVLYEETERLLLETRAAKELKFVMPPFKQLRLSTESHIKGPDMKLGEYLKTVL